MSEPKHIIVSVRAPKNGDAGTCAEAFYTVDDGVVTLTDRNGKTVRNSRGDTYKHTLQDGDAERVIAGRLLNRFRSSVLGKDKLSGFNRPLSYPRVGRA